MKKRVLSLILALVLCVGLLPMAASAAKETTNARQVVAKMPDNPGVPVFVDVTKSSFWPQESSWKYPVSIEEVYSQIEEVTLGLIKGKSSDTEKAKAIFDWLNQNISYDYEAYANKAPLSPAQQAFYVFYRKTGVCEGYAQLTNLMNIIAGLPTAYIDGKANMAHSWNAVYADGRWIYYDSTWNDWVVDPCFYHDSIKGINIYGEFFYGIPGAVPEVNMLSQKVFKLPEDLVIPSCVDRLEGKALPLRAVPTRSSLFSPE